MKAGRISVLASVLMVLLALGVAPVSYGAGQFTGAWPYSVPPMGHFNTFVTNAITLGIYYDLIEQPLAMYYWGTGEWLPLLATSWEVLPKDKPTNLRVYLRKGVKWQDGKDFTSKDVVCTFQLAYLKNWAVWKYIDKVEAIDDYTVNFHMSQPAPVVERYALRSNIRSAAVYGTWADKVADLMAKGKTLDSKEMKALSVEFDQFRPAEMIGTGPFILDPKNLTEAEVTLTKFAGAWNADKVAFDRLRVVNGETATVTPLVLAKEVDYATHGFPPATVKQFQQEGIRILRPPLYSGPAIYFNNDIYPLNRVEVRRAIAYAINRDENAVVSLGESAKRQRYMAGFSDNLVPLWVSEAAMKKLNPYDYDLKKAEALLTGIGFKRGKDGVWVTDKGTRMEYEMIVPAEYADWTAAAENAANQLTSFGIKTTVRGITYTQHPQEVHQSRFQLAVAGWGAANPHPHFSFYADLFTYNYPYEQGKGMNFPLQQKTKVVGDIDMYQATLDCAVGFNVAPQKALVEKLSLAFNELVPIVPLWERYGNNPAVEGVRVTGWPKDSDPIYKNSAYADNFVVMMIMEGILKSVSK